MSFATKSPASSTILENCLNDYKLIKIDENSVFMSGRVLCKLKNSHNLVVKTDEKLAYKVVAKTTSGQINAGDLVAKLKPNKYTPLAY